MKIVNKVKTMIIAMAIAVFGLAVVPVGAGVSALDCDNPADCAGQGAGNITGEGKGSQEEFVKTIKNIINWVTWIIGIVAVLVIIYGGFQYMISAGNKDKVTGAKNTILYGVIGLIIALVAGIIVNFVIGLL